MSESGLKFLKRQAGRPKYFTALHSCFHRMAAIRVAVMLAFTPVFIPATSAHAHIFINAKLDITADKQNQVQNLAQI